MHFKTIACLLTAFFALWVQGAPVNAFEGSRPPPHLNFEPPRIVVSNRPTRLMLVDGPPVRMPIAGTGLEFVVNTDWSVFYGKDSQAWYILDDGHWMTSNFFTSGDWKATVDLPPDFLTLQVSSDWPKVSKAMPPVRSKDPVRPILVSYEPTELILVDGEIRLGPIPGSELQYVANTRNDLFLLDGRYYLLVSGRWFTTKDLKRQWHAARDLPSAFSEIPEGHVKSYVLASVPGTPAAERAREEALKPRFAVVERGAGKGLEVPYIGEPSFVDIEETALRRAENTPFQVLMHNNFYYLCHDGAWYSSSSPHGPWQAALQVPEAIYSIPPTDPAFNVTYVHLESFDDSTNEVAYRSTSGYYSKYWTGSSVVYGTGWYYPGYYNRSVYWRYPYTYGYPRAYWDPYWNYGYHYSATFEVDRAEKDWEWSLDGSKRRVYDYGPRNYVGSGEYIMYDSKPYDSERDKP
jgi:hypothetical protein